jgi:hypothetical protein
MNGTSRSQTRAIEPDAAEDDDGGEERQHGRR